MDSSISFQSPAGGIYNAMKKIRNHRRGRGYPDHMVTRQPAPKEMENADVDPEDLLQNPESVRKKILIGAALILSIVTLGYVYDAITSEIKHEADIEFSNFLAKSAFIWNNLNFEVDESRMADPGMSEVDVLARMVNHVSEENYVKNLGGSNPTGIHLRIGSHSRTVSHALDQKTLSSLISRHDAFAAWEHVLDGDDGIPNNLIVKKCRMEVGDQTFQIVEIPFAGQLGTLTLVSVTNVDPLIFYRSLKSVALQAIVIFWLGMWGAIILAVFVSRRLKGSNAAISNAFDALNTAKIDAETANKSKSEFLANMSHELRTPMNSVLGFSEVIKNEMLGPIDNDAYRDYADNIHLSGTHLLNLINEILEVSKIEAGAVQLDESEIDVGEALDLCRVMLANRIDKQNVNVSFNIADDLPCLVADPTYFKQIAMNLISNAIKYNRNDGSVMVKVELNEDGGMIFTVKDNGVGIKQSDMSRVKERFGRAASSVANPIGGIGLGLTIVNLLCEKHQAQFTLESAFGKGTLATVIFPSARVHRYSLAECATSRMTA